MLTHVRRWCEHHTESSSPGLIHIAATSLPRLRRNRPLNLGPDSGLDELNRALAGSEVARGTIVGLYQR
ncbi:hypothetical protein [Saccharopolyspora mangrovi]|uniref:Uncharacterized protein n=1 Tax=Saccharopolyspora mangrovi TaxID=3082379 RepID=A0ABU6AE58_9PSEU|nr:hypothetical protein [Saccharopolyspora sp. S2-29]MEB3369814.1 hypothetical protein [Saccharopolyspora sp. S2-29]